MSALLSKRTITVVLLLTVLLAGSCPATAGPLQLTPGEQAWLRAHPVVRARISPTYPPFEFYDNGSFHGMAYDYAQLIAGRLGIRIEPVTGISWKDALEQIKSRSGVDLVVLITRDRERESFIEFTRDYISFPEVIFTRKDSRFVSGVKDLYGTTIASENNFIEIDYLKRDIPQVKIIETKTTEEALARVATGKADAYLGNLAVASYLIEKKGFANLKVAAPSPYPDDAYAMGVRKDWPELARIFDKALASMSEEEHRQIRQKWLSLRYEHGLRLLDVVKWVAIVAGILFVFIVQLRRMVRQRTEELQRLNQTLEAIVAERTAQLEKANIELTAVNDDLSHREQALEGANRQLEAFAFSVSHDLRAPIQHASSFAAILQNDFGESMPADARDICNRITASCRRMEDLINGILDFSLISRQGINKSAVNMGAMVREIVKEMEICLNKRQVDFLIGDLPPCQADPLLMRQVLTNLLSNAVKYTRLQDVARIEVGWLKESGETVYFVRDNGSGFDMQYADRLFGVFSRLHRQEEFEGTGVGLAIVANIVHRHEGRIWAEAAPGQGATFYFTIPA